MKKKVPFNISTGSILNCQLTVPHKNASLILWATSICANRAHLSKSKPDFLPEDRK